MFDLKQLKEETGTHVTGTTCFNKVMEVMGQDPEVKAFVEQLDYALPSDRVGADLTENLYVACYLDAGSEGCWINVLLADADNEVPPCQIGTVKTLCEGLSAWRFMGTLSGEIAYLCNQYIWYNVQ